MKKLLILSALTISNMAFGTTARMTALGHAVHLIDVKSVFVTPSDMLLLPETMELNFGSNAIGQNTDGGMIRSMGEAKLGFFVGANDTARGSGYLGVENPFTVAYAAKAGDMSWGVLFNYSNSNKKVTAATADDQTQNQMGLVGSLVMGDTTFTLGMTLADKAKGNGTDETVEMTKAPMTLGVVHKMADWSIYGSYMMDTTKVTGTDDKKETDITIGALNDMKSEGADFFYGFGYTIHNDKQGTAKTDRTELPFLIGIEADAASWLTLRGSVTQNVLLGGEKTDTNGMDTRPHNTKVAAGMGFKFTKSTLDITLTAAGGPMALGDGKINASNFGANAGFAYLF